MPLAKFRLLGTRVRRFARRVFVMEGRFLRRFAFVASRPRRLRLAWIGFVVLSLGAHGVGVYLARGSIFQVPAGEPPPPATELSLTVRLPPPPAAADPPQPLPPVEPLTQIEDQEEEPAPGPRSADINPAPAAPPGVIGIGPGSPGHSQGGGGGGGAGTAGRRILLEEFGGSRETEEAVRRGLVWLAAHQSGDGRWDCDGFDACCPPDDRCSGRGHPQYDAGVTALALAAFLAQGESPPPGWKTAAGKARDFLLRCQQARGNFGPEDANFMYNQAIAVYSLAKAHAAHPTPELGAALARALVFAAQSRQAGGGWDYTSRATGRNDLSITGWQVLAFEACREAGLEVPDTAATLASIERMHGGGSGLVTYADKGLGRDERRPGLAPVALLGLLLCGRPVADPQARILADATLRLPPEARGRTRWQETGQSLYYWYYGTLALFHLGGRWWKEWNPAMKDALLKLQRADGHRAGSWDPDPNWIGQTGGRVYATAIAVLTLEVYYRVRPRYLGSL
ncbi:MAG: hypothetical protein BWX69_00359 [Planctomycetes bacterium ADurb.Bin069]|nr:MAG: hypothetical protein BWX69_00359 [Planctomycetes bacterium ADurb.Bin069]